MCLTGDAAMITTDRTALRTATLTVTGADAIEQFLSSTYGSGMHVHSDTDRPWLRHHRIDAGMLALDTLEQAAGSLDFRVAPLQAIAIGRISTCRVQRSTCGGRCGHGGRVGTRGR